MLYWFLMWLSPALERVGYFSAGESRVFLTARAAVAAVVSFVVAWALGPAAIRWLKQHARERIDSASPQLNQLHAHKASTPTMGGVFIVAAILAAGVFCGDLSNGFLLIGLGAVLSFGLLGAWDDWTKNRLGSRGLFARTKFAVQLLLAAGWCAALTWLLSPYPEGHAIVLPVGSWQYFVGWGLVPWAMLVMVGSSNGVNLTDGLDGLASGCLVFAGSGMAVMCYLSGHRVMSQYLGIPHIPGAGELAVLFGAMVGAQLGFLWYNCHPAQVFMGDAGSLPTGALLGLGAVAIRQELLLVVLGGVFVIETLSVIIQVASFRLRGRRVLACSPLHNHFVFRGEPETRIVVRFWIAAALLALVSLACLKLR